MPRRGGSTGSWPTPPRSDRDRSLAAAAERSAGRGGRGRGRGRGRGWGGRGRGGPMHVFMITVRSCMRRYVHVRSNGLVRRRRGQAWCSAYACVRLISLAPHPRAIAPLLQPEFCHGRSHESGAQIVSPSELFRAPSLPPPHTVGLTSAPHDGLLAAPCRRACGGPARRGAPRRALLRVPVLLLLHRAQGRCPVRPPPPRPALDPRADGASNGGVAARIRPRVRRGARLPQGGSSHAGAHALNSAETFNTTIDPAVVVRRATSRPRPRPRPPLGYN